jgi:hypothetical protein
VGSREGSVCRIAEVGEAARGALRWADLGWPWGEERERRVIGGIEGLEAGEAVREAHDRLPGGADGPRGNAEEQLPDCLGVAAQRCCPRGQRRRLCQRGSYRTQAQMLSASRRQHSHRRLAFRSGELGRLAMGHVRGR